MMETELFAKWVLFNHWQAMAWHGYWYRTGEKEHGPVSFQELYKLFKKDFPDGHDLYLHI